VILDSVKGILRETLNLGDRVEAFDESTPLFGSLPEFDSMAVVSVVLALEERFGIVIEGEDIGEETFESLGSIVKFVAGKLETS